MNKYYSMSVQGNEAEIYIFGDIVTPLEKEWFGLESDTSGLSLVQDIAALGNVSAIHVHINSYGGAVSEGLAIYNTLKNHSAKIITYDDGFACSAASVVFMAGEERIMSEASLLMIHNAWTHTQGNAEQLRKDADDLEMISETAANTYMGGVTISREELDELLANESWITPADAIAKGFATSIAKVSSPSVASQSVKNSIISKLVSQPAPCATPSNADMAQFQAALDDIRAQLAALKPKEEPEPPAQTNKRYFNFGGKK